MKNLSRFCFPAIIGLNSKVNRLICKYFVFLSVDFNKFQNNGKDKWKTNHLSYVNTCVEFSMELLCKVGCVENDVVCYKAHIPRIAYQEILEIQRFFV